MPRQRIGLILGLIAWCMQLVVFVQPFLPGHSVPGFGVCQMIIDAFRPSQPSIPRGHAHHTQSAHAQNHYIQGHHNQNHHAAQPAHATAPPAQQQVAGNQWLDHSASAPVHSADHYLSHLSCGFCTLYGHVIPLPGHQPVWSTAAQTVYVTLPHFIYYSNISLLKPAYIKPQSRAPPAYYIA